MPFDAVVSSPLDRCLDTAAAVLEGRSLELQVDDRLGECRYGDWTGRPLKELAKDPLWKVVQAHPSAVTFPGPEGEPLRETQARAVAAVRDWNARLGPDATWLACSHGDVIKAVVADAMGLHLDQFQRIIVDPCSVTVIRYTELRPFVVRVNDTGGGVPTSCRRSARAGGARARPTLPWAAARARRRCDLRIRDAVLRRRADACDRSRTWRARRRKSAKGALRRCGREDCLCR